MELEVKQPDLVARGRIVERLVGGQFVTDGAGVKINRVLTHQLHGPADHKGSPPLLLPYQATKDHGGPHKSYLQIRQHSY